MQILCDSVHIFKHAINIFETLFRITHHVTCYQFFIVEIIVENVNKMMSKQIRKFYHHDGEQLGFYEKIHIKTQSKKNEVLAIFTLQETKNSNLFDKNCTHENVKRHIPHEES